MIVYVHTIIVQEVCNTLNSLDTYEMLSFSGEWHKSIYELMLKEHRSLLDELRHNSMSCPC